MDNTSLTLEAEKKYSHQIDTVLRNESRGRLAAEKAARKQSGALAATLSLAQGKTSSDDYIAALLRAITRECSAVWTSFWNVDGLDTRRVASYFEDYEAQFSVESYSSTHPTDRNRVSTLFHALLSEYHGTTVLKADDKRFPVSLRKVFKSVGVVSIILSPLSVGNQLLGWISCLSSTAVRQIDIGQVAFIEAAANQATLALYLGKLSRSDRNDAMLERQSDNEKVAVAEQSRVARDLHDLIAQSFSGILLQIEAMRTQCKDVPLPMDDRLEKIRAQATQGIDEIRRTLNHQRPALLSGQSLVQALRSFVDDKSALDPVRIVFINLAGDPALGSEMEVHLFAIVSEAVQNAIRHAGAAKITIHLARREQNLVLSIRDNGQGFPVGGGRSDVHSHFGLANMRTRAREIGAKFFLKTKPGQGTEIRVTIPQ